MPNHIYGIVLLVGAATSDRTGPTDSHVENRNIVELDVSVSAGERELISRETQTPKPGQPRGVAPTELVNRFADRSNRGRPPAIFAYSELLDITEDVRDFDDHS